MIKYLDLKAINAPFQHAADEVLQSGWYLKGEYTRRFEEAYADYIGTKYCIGCANGLDALTLIFRAYIELGVMQKGDEVIVFSGNDAFFLNELRVDIDFPQIIDDDRHTMSFCVF